VTPKQKELFGAAKIEGIYYLAKLKEIAGLGGIRFNDRIVPCNCPWLKTDRTAFEFIHIAMLWF